MGQFNYTGIKSVFARSGLGVRAPARVLVYLCVRVYRLFGVNLEFVCRARVLSTSDPPREEFMRLIHIGIVSDEFFFAVAVVVYCGTVPKAVMCNGGVASLPELAKHQMPRTIERLSGGRVLLLLLYAAALLIAFVCRECVHIQRGFDKKKISRQREKYLSVRRCFFLFFSVRRL